MYKPGPKNLITDVDGLRVGNAEDHDVRTGVTIVVPDRSATAAVDVRGGAPGTRETDALSPDCLVDGVDAVFLSGGSAFGLDAGSEVMTRLAAMGRGFQVGDKRVPIVTGAVLFDLMNGGDKDWDDEPPYRALASAAIDGLSRDPVLGNVGAGLGAKAGDLKGGLGSASIVSDKGLQVGALIAVNAAGSAVMPGQATLWAASWEIGGEMGGQPLPDGPVSPDPSFPFIEAAEAGRNTTIGVVATNAILTKAEARRVAIMAHDGMARALRPSHTPFDGDTLFVLATGTHDLGNGPGRALELARLGALAADTVTRAIGRGVFLADSLGDFPSWRDRFAERVDED